MCFVFASEKNRLFSRFHFSAARIKARLMSHTLDDVMIELLLYIFAAAVATAATYNDGDEVPLSMVMI